MDDRVVPASLAQSYPSRTRLSRLVRIFGRALRWVFIIAMLAFVMVPLIWMFITAIKTRVEITTATPVFIPEHPTFDNFREALGIGGGTASQRSRAAFLNSLIVAGASTAGVIAIGLPAAYALARIRLTRATPLLRQNTLFARMVPQGAIVIPLFLQFTWLGIVDTRLGLTLIYISMLIPFGVLILMAFVLDMPRDIEEAAVVDGASTVQILYYIVRPLMAPALVATGVISFVLAWNEFFFALIFTRQAAQTFPIQINSLIGTAGIQWGPMTAAGLVGMIPPVVALVVTYRYLVAGLTLGAVK